MSGNTNDMTKGFEILRTNPKDSTGNALFYVKKPNLLKYLYYT
jgi:hypothetical protein